jgi:AcrR family transcriptional regulator
MAPAPRTAPKRRRTQADRTDQMRRRLIEASIALLRQNGYAGFRTADVAARAKVSRGGQLHHFRTKDSLVLGALEEIYRRASVASEARLAAIQGPVHIEDIIKDAEAYYFADNFFTSLDVTISAGKSRRISAQVKEIAFRYRQPIEELWANRLVQRGVPMRTARNAVWLIHSAVRGLTIRAMLPHPAAQLQDTLQMIVKLLESELGHPAAKNLRAVSANA